MNEEHRKMNLTDVYNYGDGSPLDNTDLKQYYATLQDCIRRNCNDGNDPLPFRFEKLVNSDLIILDTTYDEKLKCVRTCIEETECKIFGLRNALLEWVDRMSES